MGKFLDFESIRAQFPIVEVIKTLLGAELVKSTDNKYRGKCPFCDNERTFVVTTDAGDHKMGLAGCFKCGPKGDSIATVAKKFGIKANEAAELIVERMAGTVAKVDKVSIPADDKLEKIAARLVHDHEDVQALGLTPETAKALGIGYIKSGVLAGRVLFPLYRDGKLAGFVGYSPESGLKFPPQIVPQDNVVKFPKAG